MEDINTRRLLEAVAESCRASQAKYEAAEREASDGDLKYLFSSYARQRARFVREWERLWSGRIVDKSPATLGRERSECRGDRILAERAAAEEEMMRLYEEVLGLDLAEELRALLERQWSDIRTAHARIGELRELASPNAGR